MSDEVQCNCNTHSSIRQNLSKVFKTSNSLDLSNCKSQLVIHKRDLAKLFYESMSGKYISISHDLLNWKSQFERFGKGSRCSRWFSLPAQSYDHWQWWIVKLGNWSDWLLVRFGFSDPQTAITPPLPPNHLIAAHFPDLALIIMRFCQLLNILVNF